MWPVSAPGGKRPAPPGQGPVRAPQGRVWQKSPEKQGSRKTIFIFLLLSGWKQNAPLLTVLCLPQKGENAKKYFYENLGTMTFVELTQDVIHGERARAALLSMAERSGLEADNRLFQNWQEDRGYRFGELRQLFEEWQSNKLKLSLIHI